MAVRQGRDRAGRTYWYDPETGRRVRAPETATAGPVGRPLFYRVDAAGRGYWIWGDTGRRAPRPARAPSTDAAGRPRDSAGRMVPAHALGKESPPQPAKPERTLSPGSKPKAGRPPKKPPKKKPAEKPPKKPAKKPPKKPPEPTPHRKPVKLPPRIPVQLRGPREDIPGFEYGKGAYMTKVTHSLPFDLETIFLRWLKGAVAKSALASASEIGFRQHGMVFTVHAPLDARAFEDLTKALEGMPVRLVIRALGNNNWEIWVHLVSPDKRKKTIKQRSYRDVARAIRRAEAAMERIYEFLEEWTDEIAWHLYFETDDDVYEG